jgi:Ca2+-binding RTX toxin-like protein
MRTLVMFVTVTTALAFPGSALASRVTTEDGSTVFRSGALASDVSLSPAGSDNVAYTDALQRLNAGPGCIRGNPVLCSTAGVTSQVLRLSPGDDRARASSPGFALSVYGGFGNDDIAAYGDRTEVFAGPDDDTVVASSNGTATVSGGEGDDAIRTESGTDASLRGDLDDDLIVTGLPGRNDVIGGEGDDDIIVTSGSTGTGTITGGLDDDTILIGSTGPVGYLVNAGPDDDTVVGGGGSDDVRAGDGDDLVDVSGDPSSVDKVNCGLGDDTVFADPQDKIAANCEHVESGPMPRPEAIDDALAHLASAFPGLTP